MKLISWNTTRRCNLKCRHCYRDAGERDRRELTWKEGRDLLQEIKKAGFNIIVFSGGEPLMRDDIYDLIKFSAGLGMRPVFGSNGTLITKDVAFKLKDAGLTRAGISLDSLDRERHDDFRQVDGSWDAAVEGMRNCLKAGLDFQVHTTVTERNYAEIEDLTDFAVELGARAHHIFFLVPAGRGKEIGDVLSKSHYEKLLHRILEKQKTTSIELKPTCAPQFMRVASQKGMSMRFSKGCLAGISYCCILPNGDVHPCPYFQLKVGNVREEKFSVIWDNPVFMGLRGNKLGGKCGRCSFNSVCGGCRARAFYNTGNYMDEDPMCMYKPP